jgi:rhamnosyl/mannosyltransferase
MRTLWDNPLMAAEMGRRAEARYWELFTAERMAQNYAQLYRELAGR